MAARYLNVIVKLKDDAAKAGLKSLGVSGTNVMKGLGTAAAAAGTAVVGIGVAGVNSYLKVSRSMAEVETLLASMPNHAEQAKEYLRGVQNQAMEFGLSTEELTAGLYQTISALGAERGVTANLNTLSTAAQLAKTGVADVDSSVKLLTGVSKAYGDISDEMIDKLASMSFQAVKLGVTTMPELADSFGKVAGVAAPLGIDVEELFGILATFTGQGRDTSEVVTAMSQSVVGFLKENKTMSDVIEKSGYASAEALVKEKGLAESIKFLKEKTDESGDSFAKLLGRKESIWLASVMLGDQYDTMIDKTGQMYDANKTLDEAYEAFTDGIGEQAQSVEELKSKYDVMLERIGELILTEGPEGKAVIDDISEALGGMADALADPDSDLSQMIQDMKDLAAIAIDVVGAIKDFADSVRGVGDWYFDSWLYDLNPMSWFQSRQLGSDQATGMGQATQDYVPGSGQYIPHSERGASAIPVVITNVDVGSSGLLEAING